MRFLTFAAMLLLVVSATAERGSQSEVFASSCATVRVKAEAFLQERHWRIDPPDACASCIQASTPTLRDADGHRLVSRGGIVRHYTTKADYVKPPGPAWIVHSAIHVTAKLHLEPVPAACKADLLFQYTWYGAELILGLPVDGDPDSGPSNGRLEREYLERLGHELQPKPVP